MLGDSFAGITDDTRVEMEVDLFGNCILLLLFIGSVNNNRMITCAYLFRIQF